MALLMIVVPTTCILALVAVYLKFSTFRSNIYVNGKTPHIIFILMKLAWRALTRKQGVLYYSSADRNIHTPSSSAKLIETVSRPTDLDKDQCTQRASEDEIITITNLRVTEEQINQFKRVCCGQQDDKDHVPLCFPECLFMSNVLLLVCRPSFKLSPLGLIHLGQTITLHGCLEDLLTSSFSLETKVLEYRLKHRGVEVDIETQIISISGSCLWTGVATLLSRAPHVQQSGSVLSEARQQQEQESPEFQGEYQSIELHAASDTGLKYAYVSGDWNPHHLYTWTARILGYCAPIAHGLWTLARSVACISEANTSPTRFKYAEGKFKRPLFLPGNMVLEYSTKDSIVHFRVLDLKSRAPHLIGSLH